jgi:hypothetical protein
MENKFQIRYLWCIAQFEYERNKSKKIEMVQNKKITHNSLVAFFKQKTTKKMMGKYDENKLIFSNT